MILLTACTIGNIRISYMDNATDEPDCSIDAGNQEENGVCALLVTAAIYYAFNKINLIQIHII